MLNPNNDRLDYGQILAPPFGCRLDFTSTSVLFIFASLQYYQLLFHMDDPYCASVK